MDWFDLFAVQWILKTLLQHHSSPPTFLYTYVRSTQLCFAMLQCCLYCCWFSFIMPLAEEKYLKQTYEKCASYISLFLNSLQLFSMQDELRSSAKLSPVHILLHQVAIGLSFLLLELCFWMKNLSGETILIESYRIVASWRSNMFT